MKAGLGDPEVLGDLAQGSLFAASHRHDVAAELQRVRLGHLMPPSREVGPHRSGVNQTWGSPFRSWARRAAFYLNEGRVQAVVTVGREDDLGRATALIEHRVPSTATPWPARRPTSPPCPARPPERLLPGGPAGSCPAPLSLLVTSAARPTSYWRRPTSPDSYASTTACTRSRRSSLVRM
jgi:hypothetical protein